MPNQISIPGIKPTKKEILFLKCFGFDLLKNLFRIFACMFRRDNQGILVFFSSLWFWYQGNAGHTEGTGECSLFSNFLEDFLCRIGIISSLNVGGLY